MEENALDKNIRKFKTHLSTYPNKQMAQLLRGYVVPILEEMRFEYSDAFAYLEDRLDAGEGSAEGDVLEEARDTVVFLAAFLDGVLQQVGWLKENEISAEFPAELRETFEEAKGRIVSLMQSIEESQAASAEDADEDEDEEEDESEDGEASKASGESATEVSSETPPPEVIAASETQTTNSADEANA